MHRMSRDSARPWGLFVCLVAGVYFACQAAAYLLCCLIKSSVGAL